LRGTYRKLIASGSFPVRESHILFPLSFEVYTGERKLVFLIRLHGSSDSIVQLWSLLSEMLQHPKIIRSPVRSGSPPHAVLILLL
jgi:hypothetical protein